jgi:hypothetical protein
MRLLDSPASLLAGLLVVAFSPGTMATHGVSLTPAPRLKAPFGQPLMTPEGTTSPTFFVATAGASATLKSFTALGGAS